MSAAPPGRTQPVLNGAPTPTAREFTFDPIATAGDDLIITGPSFVDVTTGHHGLSTLSAASCLTSVDASFSNDAHSTADGDAADGGSKGPNNNGGYWVTNYTNTLNWKANSSDPALFSVQLLNSNRSQLNGNFQIGNALNTANGSTQIFIDCIPSGTYTMLFVNSSNYELGCTQVYYTSSLFEVRPNGTQPAQVTANTNADPNSLMTQAATGPASATLSSAARCPGSNDTIEHSHIPFPITLIKKLVEWQSTHDDNLPISKDCDVFLKLQNMYRTRVLQDLAQSKQLVGETCKLAGVEGKIADDEIEAFIKHAGYLKMICGCSKNRCSDTQVLTVSSHHLNCVQPANNSNLALYGPVVPSPTLLVQTSKATAPFAVCTKDLEIPAQDDMCYHLICLANGLEALVTQDPKADKPGTVMDICVGHLSDPEELQGPAHFCGHLSNHS
ncbi:uncharacterized protein UBRO_20924 [Ustilago bromivora]|uniref:Uncharacterized protein n=1 Tax=Ustilago bromivora TaxID=307758 RepID=A0A1K0HKN0_9BASI|nr:uncharacterized protein UBRO_20924 [Ustilago bromivora]SYW86220.1 uncharacterized protein UBRO2_05940 [Ustilago bromivora]